MLLGFAATETAAATTTDYYYIGDTGRMPTAKKSLTVFPTFIITTCLMIQSSMFIGLEGLLELVRVV